MDKRRIYMILDEQIEVFKQLYERLEYDEALKWVDKLIKVNPKEARLHRMRGAVLRNMGEYRKAINAFKKAILLDPNEPKGYFERGLYYDIKFMRDRALADYNEALRLNPDFIQVYIARASRYMPHEEAKALADFDKAISLDPNEMSIYAARANFYIQLDEVDKAVADANYALQNGCHVPIVYMVLIQAHANQEQFEEALQLCHQLIERYPSIHSFYDMRANLYIELGDNASALQDLNTALSLKNPEIETYLTRASLLMDMHNYQEALADIVVVLDSPETSLFLQIQANYLQRMIESLVYIMPPIIKPSKPVKKQQPKKFSSRYRINLMEK